ncbi:MAG TPA: 3-hydroxyacyl-CoA dehydrogenase NAD-binding domain-containing protein [Longimicrobiaceae bacterium]|nr:3-hydroxyacyl-CoA dehydrogenase NAD-binding domain-containing protein [Longimicrobiaceae bacterium]
MATLVEAPTRTLRMEIEDGIAVIRLNQPGKPVNVISRELMEEMAEVIGRLEAREGGVRAAVIVSDKPGVWIAGADIEEFTRIRTAEDGERLSRAGQELLDRLERLPIPVVAAIDGAALGGGLEVALACDYRMATDSPRTKLGLPEVQLGILPGAGGTQRLPRLIGLAGALDLMLTGKTLEGRRAMKVGLVDETVPAPILLPQALRAARELADGERRPRAGRRTGSPDWKENLPGARLVIFRRAREGVMEKTHGLYPAPLRLLEVVERGIDRPLEEGLALEARAFGELSVTPESRSLVHLFFAKTGAENRPDLPGSPRPRPVERVAVVGAGFMGAGIAAASAESGMRVRLKDVDAPAVARGLRTARETLVKRAQRRRRPRHEITQLVDRVEPTVEYIGFGNADLVVEAVFEEVELKHRVIREIEAAVSEDAILGSNTSTIPIARLAEASSRPHNVLGLHFFSPVEKMPLLEIIVHEATAPEVTATAHAYAKRLGKTPVIVNDAPGFYANRILAPYMNEAALLLEEGVRMEEIDRAMTEWGYPVGPITLYDEVGLDVAAKAGKIMADAFTERMLPSSVVERLVADGRMGRKNGRGFYRYQDGDRKGPDERVYALIGSPPRREVPRSEIQERLALVMVNEAVRTLEEGVLRSARDGDVGAILGIGFPPFRGGPFWYLDRTGADRVVARLRVLEVAHGLRFTPAPLLVEQAEGGGKFFDAAVGPR